MTNEKKQKKMITYAIKHIPTGLYYKPGKINLAKRGKFYAQKPNLKFICKLQIAEKDERLFQEKGIKIYKLKAYKLPIIEYKREDFEIEKSYFTNV